jgi:hypothetical protein
MGSLSPGGEFLFRRLHVEESAVVGQQFEG